MKTRIIEINHEIERLSLEKALIEFSEDQKQRLFEKEKQGFSGWDDPEDKALIFEKFFKKVDLLKGTKEGCPSAKRIYIDIANFCMMLSYIEELEYKSNPERPISSAFDKYDYPFDRTLSPEAVEKLRESELLKLAEEK